MGNLIYCSYGLGRHVAEARFSILSALRFGPERSGVKRLLVYTDTPDAFEGLGATVHRLTAEQLDAWVGYGGYHYKRKIVVLGMALRAYDGPSVLMDGDTFFRRPPGRLFARVRPGQAVMHLREGRLGWVTAMGKSGFVGKRFPLDGEVFEATPESSMWNSGVVGVDPADVAAVDQAAALCDVIQQVAPSRISEQLAFTLTLDRRTKLVGCRDLVYHYYVDRMRRALHEVLPEVTERYRDLPLPERGQAMFRHRPVNPLNYTLRTVMKRVVRPLGLYRHNSDHSF